MEEKNLLNPITFQSDARLSKLLGRARVWVSFQAIALSWASFTLLPLLLSKNGEGRGWALLIFGPYIILSITAFLILSTVGLINSIKLLNKKIVNVLSVSFLLLSFLCFVVFLIGVVTIVLPVLSSNAQYANQQKIEKTDEQEKIDFFHQRYQVLSQEFKDQQKVSNYMYGVLSITGADNTSEVGKFTNGKTKLLLLGYSGVNGVFPGDSISEARQKTEEEKNTAIVDKSVTVVLPDEVTFTKSYSCDGPYQNDCYLNYKNSTPVVEYFYAKVYLDGRLLNDEYTVEQQEIAKNGLQAMQSQSALITVYHSLVMRFQYQQKILSTNVGDKIYLTLENTDKSLPGNPIFSKPTGVILDGVNLSTPYSLAQQQRIEEFLKENVVGHLAKITAPDFSEIQSANKNFDSDQGLSQISVQIYLEGEKQSLSDQLKALIK